LAVSHCALDGWPGLTWVSVRPFASLPSGTAAVTVPCLEVVCFCSSVKCRVNLSRPCAFMSSCRSSPHGLITHGTARGRKWHTCGAAHVLCLRPMSKMSSSHVSCVIGYLYCLSISRQHDGDSSHRCTFLTDFFVDFLDVYEAHAISGGH